MRKIKDDIYIEDRYPGVTVGAVLRERGTVFIDAPLRPDDGRDWLNELHKKGAKGESLLVNLDAHPDRTLGAQILNAEALAQRETARQFQRRSAIFKALKQETGAEWEQLSGLSGLRWVMPQVIFSDQSSLHFDGDEIRVEYHPGPNAGASWAVLPAAKVVFVGDLVTLKQPPFLAEANIDRWIDSLDILRSGDYEDYTVVSGRGGIAKPEDLDEMRDFLRDVQRRLERKGEREADAEETEKLVSKLIEKYEYPKKYRELYSRRLRHGLYQYYERHY